MHLPDLLRDYFSVFERYLVDSGIEMTFEEFCKEVYERRDIMLGLGMLVSPPMNDPSARPCSRLI